MTNEEMEIQLVDKHGMANVLRGLSGIASAKAEHVKEWSQDRELARAWEKLAEKLIWLSERAPT